MTDSAKLAGLRVLVVEDEMMVSMLIEDMLTDLGCAIVGPASRLDEAMELARATEFDCAVLDVNLGGQPIVPVADLPRGRSAAGARPALRLRHRRWRWGPARSGPRRAGSPDAFPRGRPRPRA